MSFDTKIKRLNQCLIVVSIKNTALKNDTRQTLYCKKYDKKGKTVQKKIFVLKNVAICTCNKNLEFQWVSQQLFFVHSFYLQHSVSDNYMMIIQSWLFYDKNLCEPTNYLSWMSCTYHGFCDTHSTRELCAQRKNKNNYTHNGKSPRN